MSYACVVSAAWDETPSLRVLQWKDARVGLHRPGGVVLLRCGGFQSVFGLARLPGEEGLCEVLVRRGSAVSDAVVAAAYEGAVCDVGVLPEYGFDMASLASGDDIVLCAMGSGMGPVKTVVETLVRERGQWGRVVLYAGVRSHYEKPYVSFWDMCEKNAVDVRWCVSEEGQGYVQEVAPRESWGGCAPGRTHVFLCGSRGMENNVRWALLRDGFLPTSIHVNHVKQF